MSALGTIFEANRATNLSSLLAATNLSCANGDYETQIADFKRKLIQPAVIDAKGHFEVAAAKLNRTSRNLRRLVRVSNVKLP